MMDIYGKDCKYHVSTEQKRIICAIGGTGNRFLDFLKDNSPTKLTEKQKEILKMPSFFYGVAQCAPEDEWDEEFGKRLAFKKAKRKLMNSFYKRIRTYFDMQEKKLDDFEIICKSYQNKVERNMERE